MKRIIAAVLCLVLCMGMTAFAFGTEEMLSDLGLMQGTGSGFEPELHLTRAQAAVLAVRLMGAEDEALEKGFSHDFTDVPLWADAYVGWLDENGLIPRISDGLFRSGKECPFDLYLYWVLKALKYEVRYAAYGECISTALEAGIVTDEILSGGLTRAAAAEIAANAVFSNVFGENHTLLRSLENAGAVSEGSCRKYIPMPEAKPEPEIVYKSLSGN